MNKCMSNAIPKKCNSFDPKFPIWFNSKLISLIRKKNNAKRKFKKNPNCSYLKLQFTKLRSTVKKELKSARRFFLLKAESAIKINPKKIWNFTKSMREDRCVHSIIFDDVPFTSPKDISNSFADMFKRTYADNSYTSPQFNLPFSNNLFIETVTETEVQNCLNKLNGSTVCGPDSLPSFILKGCSEFLLQPLCHIFNLSLTHNHFPESWKISRICPVLKKGSKNVGLNYRPISILCAVSKVLELILYERLYACVENSLSVYQHGFIRRRSTVSNLATYINYIAKSLENRSSVHAIYFDLSKAFDTVDHKILLDKFFRIWIFLSIY